jgi:mRNA interferase MazF
MTIKKGDIFVAGLDPTMGSEIAKTRPVVIVSNDKNNHFSPTVTVLPITSQKTGKTYPFEVFLKKGIGNLPKDSKVKADQIRTLDKRRLIQKVGTLPDALFSQVATALKIHLDLL